MTGPSHNKSQYRNGNERFSESGKVCYPSPEASGGLASDQGREARRARTFSDRTVSFRVRGYSYFFSNRQALVPPKPKELVRA